MDRTVRIRIEDILENVRQYITQPDLALIQLAFMFAAKAHQGVMRRSGEPYISHPIEVAYILTLQRMDETAIAAGLLHDTVEDAGISIDEIHELFGEEVADIVDGLTKISRLDFPDKLEAQAESIRKMLLAAANDPRVLVVKLADRLHNMRTLEFMKPHQQLRIAQETLEIYTPLANRLGLHSFKVELEDLCLKYLKPDVYAQLQEKIANHPASKQEYIDKVVALLTAALLEKNIEGNVFGRTKHLFSIYTKMQQQGLKFDEIFDLLAFRIVVPTLEDCYAILAYVHGAWKSIQARFKDYISRPKENGYQSLHTAVFGPDNEIIEIQIRSAEMHQIAEYGVAAHWEYKEVGKGTVRKKTINPKNAKEYKWFRQMLEWQGEYNSEEFLAHFKSATFQKEIQVYTPTGDLKQLPAEACPIDFAYSIHSEVGDHCAGAKINGKLETLSTPLKNGDRVEIITKEGSKPNLDWLKFVKTARAKTRIKRYIQTAERSLAVETGRDLLEKEGRRRGVNVSKAIKNKDLAKVAAELSFVSAEELLAQIGYVAITPTKVINKLKALLEGDTETAVRPEHKETAEIKEKKVPSLKDAVKIAGVNGAVLHLASCCNPLPGDLIVGYVTRGRGLTVHRSDCQNVRNFEPERILSVSWEGQEEKPYPVKIRIVCLNEKGMLGKICDLIGEMDVNIDSGTFVSNVDGNSQLDFIVEVKDSTQLYAVLKKLKAVRSVREALRVD